MCHRRHRQGSPGDCATKSRLRRAQSRRDRRPHARAAGCARPARSEGSSGRGYGSASPRRGCFKRRCRSRPPTSSTPPQNFFLEAVQATNVRAEDRIVELIKVELGGRTLACVAASPRNIVESSIGMISRLGGRVGLDGAGPGRTLSGRRLLQQVHHAGSKLCVRFFLGELHAVGVLAAGSRPLFWHAFDLPSGDEIAAILAAYSTLWMMGRHARITFADRYGHHPRAAGAGPREAVRGIPPADGRPIGPL